MPQDAVPPANAIIIDGDPLWLEFEAAPGSAILPGDIVEFNTTYCTGGYSKVKEAALNTEAALGVADVEPENARTVAYDAGDAVLIACGHIHTLLRLAAGNDITCGNHLKPAASGEVALYICYESTTDWYGGNPCLMIAQATYSYSSLTTMQFIKAKLLI